MVKYCREVQRRAMTRVVYNGRCLVVINTTILKKEIERVLRLE